MTPSPASKARNESPLLTVRRVRNGRLCYFRGTPGEEYWARHWRPEEDERVFAIARKGEIVLPALDAALTAALPREGRILEGGCGRGQIVMALRARGYDVEGVEWSTETVERVRASEPDLPIRAGDVTELDVPDSYYTAYISLGVIEHREEGPDVFLREARRVVRPDGLFLVAFPHFHVLRRWKGRLGAYRGDPTELKFFQYAFHPAEIRARLAENGFRTEGSGATTRSRASARRCRSWGA